MNGIRTIRLVDVETAGGIDPDRLARALSLSVTRIVRGRYRVSGGTSLHYVDLIDPAMERCDCGDFTWRGAVCKHLLACLLREGDERVLRAVGRMATTLRAENDRLREEVRGRTIPLTRALRLQVVAACGFPEEELDFRRERDGTSADVTVVHRGSGEILGRVTRVSRPELVFPAALQNSAEPRAAA